MSVHIKLGVVSNAEKGKETGNLMVDQKWSVTVDGEEHTVEYRCVPLLGKTELIVDGVSFAVQGKPFGLGLVRREMVMVGGVQGILDVQKGGRAKLIVRDGEVKAI